MTDELAGGPLDISTLETLGRRATTHPLVTDWRFRLDPISPHVLELTLDVGQYPAAVEASRLDMRWFTDETYSFHYREETADGAWECRFDHHPKPNLPDTHYHPPPNAGPAETSPLTEEQPLDCLFWVCDWIDERVATLHNADNG